MVDLPDDIWLVILTCLQRPVPKIGQGCDRRAYHQHGLTTMMRVNKRFFDLAGKLLYQNPIIDDPAACFEGVSSMRGMKIRLLKHVRTIDVTHRQSLLGPGTDDVLYEKLDEAGQRRWDDNFHQKSRRDLDSCDRAHTILNDPLTFGRLESVWQDGVECLRIGGYDAGWWMTSMRQLHHARRISTNHFSGTEYLASGLQTMLSNQLENTQDVEEFGSTLIRLCRPRVIEQFVGWGPMSINNCLENQDGLGLLDDTQTIINHITFTSNREFGSPRIAKVIHGKNNKWYISLNPIHEWLTRDDEYVYGGQDLYDENRGRMGLIDLVLDAIMCNRTKPRLKRTSDSDSGENDNDAWTTLEVYDLRKLFRQVEKEEKEDLIIFLKQLGGVNWADYFPARLTAEVSRGDDHQAVEDRFGYWGMMELDHNGDLRFVDIKHEAYKLKVTFHDTV
ncbi:uncharacterized protein I303_103918 [Kwoniella dejecticola CBS 10117]|uniref:Uncharacterized protein n=1 Tax=Kwoniella dejecticola CBS 10117 TaxID=1296121 RepID=A0A1A6A834_9TREE|nr:uncharacterized protein I303_03936 [Kwoniella dejecticola CBS 10117]OBR86216.1 hypothetical protein I303_03936 [Kwoniella dejecticola CBS 10117]